MTQINTNDILKYKNLLPDSKKLLSNAASFNFQCSKQKLICLLGPNDSGKTNYLRTLGGVEKPLKGNVYFFNKNIWQINKSSWQELRLKAGYISPNATLLSVINILNNIMLPAQYHHLDTHENIEKRAYEILEWLNCDVDLTALPAYLNNYQHRLVMIARNLILNPELLFIDDAFAFLDPPSWEKMSHCYIDLVQQFHMTLVLATHNISFARQHADIILVTHPEGLKTFNNWQELEHSDDAYIKHYISSTYA